MDDGLAGRPLDTLLAFYRSMYPDDSLGDSAMRELGELRSKIKRLDRDKNTVFDMARKYFKEVYFLKTLIQDALAVWDRDPDGNLWKIKARLEEGLETWLNDGVVKKCD